MPKSLKKDTPKIANVVRFMVGEQAEQENEDRERIKEYLKKIDEL